ncbi:MAG: sulfite exporter TauE/SafE family protein [Succinivibrio sp.]|nr:sulfite exporter TauE/SafE family protein [Succinivibrio sp.]
MILGITFVELAITIGVLLLCGVLAGFLAGLLGVGGGIIFVPCFYLVFTGFFKIDPNIAIVVATGTSLLCMIPTSISAARSQYKKGNTDIEVIKSWSIFMLLGVVVGILVSKVFGGAWLTLLFGSVMILNSLNTMFRAKAKPAFASLPGKFGQSIISFCIACFSSMLGIGGGTLTVPVLNACSVPPHKAIGTSSAVSLFVCVPGAILMLLTNETPAHAPIGTYGLVNVLAAMCVVPVSYLCAPFGVNVGKNIKPTTLKRIFAIALFIISARMLYSGLSYYLQDTQTVTANTQVQEQVLDNNSSIVENN